MKPNDLLRRLVYYIHSDQLDTPRLITRASDNKVFWQWSNDEAFGNARKPDNRRAVGRMSVAFSAACFVYTFFIQ